MKLVLISLCMLSSGALRVCNDEKDGGASVAASAEASASVSGATAVNASVTPRIGGQITAIGDFLVEVAVRRAGSVQALVYTQAGALVSEGVKLSVTARAKGGEKTKFALAFAPPHMCFEGRAQAGVELETGPLALSLEVGGKALSGNVALAMALPEPRFGGSVVAAGDLAVELVAKGPEIKAFVIDANGKAHAGGDLDLRLALDAAPKASLKLAWDGGCLCYKGLAAGKVDLALKPIRLELRTAGKVMTSAVASIKAASALDVSADAMARLDADARANALARLDANAKANAKAKLQAPDLKAKAGAVVKVEPPKLDLKVKKSASASAGTKESGGAKAKAGASFSFGTK